jgi:hypothetical protein
MFYRRIAAQLGFDFPELEESYWTARTRDPNLTFPTLLKTQIAVEMKAPNSADSAMRQLLEALASSHNKMFAALQETFSLTPAEASHLEKVINERYKTAARNASTAR